MKVQYVRLAKTEMKRGVKGDMLPLAEASRRILLTLTEKRLAAGVETKIRRLVLTVKFGMPVGKVSGDISFTI